MDKKPSSSKAAASTSSKSEKRKADDKKPIKKGTGEPSSKKPKDEVDIDFLIQAVRELTTARHEEIENDHNSRYVELEECGNNTWKVEDEGYTVKLVRKKCKKGRKCELYCKDCRVCKHQFTCTCPEDKYLCFHVHVICMYLGVNTAQNSDDDEYDSEEEEKMTKISTAISECKSHLNRQGAKEILQKNLDRALVQLRAHEQKLKKEEEKTVEKKE